MMFAWRLGLLGVAAAAASGGAGSGSRGTVTQLIQTLKSQILALFHLDVKRGRSVVMRREGLGMIRQQGEVLQLSCCSRDVTSAAVRAAALDLVGGEEFVQSTLMPRRSCLVPITDSVGLTIVLNGRSGIV